MLGAVAIRSCSAERLSAGLESRADSELRFRLAYPARLHRELGKELQEEPMRGELGKLPRLAMTARPGLVALAMALYANALRTGCPKNPRAPW